jgi:putative glycosyltransferase (TIGR04348 family)
VDILLITPAPPGSRAGNRATATRWASFLRQAGHQVRVSVDDDGSPADLLLALHAWRSAPAIDQFRARCPDVPRIVALTGTDLYHFQQEAPQRTLAGMAAGDRLIGLHRRVADDLPTDLHARLRLVLQSAVPLSRRPRPDPRCFEVCVIGHLRAEKDPLRTAWAVRVLPERSRIAVVQAGRAHDAEHEALAVTESMQNPRYRWRGEIPYWQVRRLLARSRLMVISSRMEGGANVVSEACVSGTPVLASRIPGNVGLLGDDYPGYFDVEDTLGLRALLLRAEQEPEFLASLTEQVLRLAPSFTPAAEASALLSVVRELDS